MDRPTYEEYTPDEIESQKLAIDDIFGRVLNRPGTQIVLLSGAVGSGKSIVLQHVLADHGIQNPGSVIGMSRRTLPDLRDTLFTELVDHIPENALKGKPQANTCRLKLKNGSKYLSRTFADNKFKKVRSLEASAWGIEEVTELPTSEAYQEIITRLGRNKKRKTTLLIMATNPDSPEHWVYKEVIARAGWVNGVKTRKREGRNLDIHIYYSVTTDNIHLNKEYKDTVLATMTPKMAERMIYGKWVNIAGESAYHAYNEERNFVPEDYVVDERYPIHLNFDFNTAEGKPMSACAFQYINDHVHVFREWVVHRANTHSLMEEIVTDTKEPGGKGILDYNCQIIVHGDATGESNKSSATSSDYAIIEQYLTHYKKRKIIPKMEVPAENPPVKDRVNHINSYCYNLLNQVRLSVYSKCVTVDLGFKNTQWQKGADNKLDDSYYAQHVLDALSYGVWYICLKPAGIKKLW